MVRRDLCHKNTRLRLLRMGKIRIYLAPTEKLKAKRLWERLNGKPVYREIIRAAKEDGLMNAVGYSTHHGFSNGGRVEASDPELSNPRLTMCVELVDHKDKLELFCLRHGEMLKGKVIVYKHVEHWSIQAPGLVERELTTEG